MGTDESNLPDEMTERDEEVAADPAEVASTPSRQVSGADQKEAEGQEPTTPVEDRPRG